MFGSIFVLLYVAHYIGDYIMQNDWMAGKKGDKTRQGYLANLSHASIHVVISAAFLSLGDAYLHLSGVTPLSTVAAVAWIGCTHAFIDRRWPVAWLMTHTRSTGYLERGGAPAVDQALHIVVLGTAAFGLAV
ncbi:DUF3307 domain-containing protein [Streptomyces sp. NPDC000927]|uniref:DUF3307 domain-containing protein n=1 Tax=Streptomyces sp. NPDC000927 TaxID=3154371 RepID=UPI00331AA4A8